jgi:anhydro-N-acetylmuramic acid kinase
MAYGGSGAPFAPAFHQFIFKNIESRTAVVNIGGIANITVLGTPLTGYDTGPGNMLMDAWIATHRKVAYDADGSWAREGKVDYGLLDRMMADAYFSLPYPKSTGREKFNLAWLSAFKSGIAPVDMQRTLLELTAQSIANEVLRFNPDILMLCGGGAKNSFLVERIAALMPNIQVGIMAQADWLEAMMMAWLAYKRIHEEPVELKEVTGARENTLLGAVYQ